MANAKLPWHIIGGVVFSLLYMLVHKWVMNSGKPADPPAA